MAAAALALPAAAWSQAYQCRVPARVSVPEVEPDGPARRMPITGYTLALSWSPEFCKGRETRAADRLQCSGRNGRFGLVVHGLWPEGRSGWPQYCATPRSLSPALVRRNLCMMPSARMIAHEWVRHGSCMAQRPETYFTITRILWEGLRKPDLDRLSRKDELTAGDIRRAIADANEGWRPEHIGVHLDRRGWLEEIRTCYAKDFMPAPCGPRRFGAANSEAAKIWRGL